MTNRHEEHLANLSEIRSMMERSTRFLSLSGLSGVSAGIVALIGAWAMATYFGLDGYNFSEREAYSNLPVRKWGMSPLTFLLLDAGLVMLLAFLFGLYFTNRKAKKQGRKIWTRASRRLAFNSAVPMAVGGLFCLIMLSKGHFGAMVYNFGCWVLVYCTSCMVHTCILNMSADERRFSKTQQDF